MLNRHFLLPQGQGCSDQRLPETQFSFPGESLSERVAQGCAVKNYSLAGLIIGELRKLLLVGFTA